MSNKNSDAVITEVVKLKDTRPIQPHSPVPAGSPGDHIGAKLLQHSCLDRPTTPIDISDKLHLLHSSCSSGISDGGSRKEKKHKKKDKKDSESWSCDKLRGDSSSRSDSSLKKKIKHKKDKQEKKKHKKKDSASSDSDSYDNRRDTKHSKHKYSHLHFDSSVSSDEDRRKRRRKTSKNEDLDGYEWVEKTIETTNVRDSSSKSNNRASVQSWNHHIKDDVAPRKEASSDKIKVTWDGSRASEFTAGLDGTSYSFGNSVLSWDGHKNHIDREVEEEDKAKRKRHWSDAYNEEIDAGKLKKVKKHIKETLFSSDNLFQHYQSMKHRAEYGPSWSQDHSYHQHHDHHYHKNSSSLRHWVKKNDYHTINKHSDYRFKSYKPQSSTYSQ